MTGAPSKKLVYWLPALFLAAVVWSVVNPKHYGIWVLEASPALVAFVILALTYRRFPLTPLTYVLIFLHAVVLLIGAHYTYAEMPLFDRLQEIYDLPRNYYDRLGHFFQGFVPAVVARELLVRTSPLKPGKWLFTLVTLSVLGISAGYELLEWTAAAVSETGAEEFLATQGDVWDTQKDMALALTGAVISQLVLAGVHDRQLAALAKGA